MRVGQPVYCPTRDGAVCEATYVAPHFAPACVVSLDVGYGRTELWIAHLGAYETSEQATLVQRRHRVEQDLVEIRSQIRQQLDAKRRSRSPATLVAIDGRLAILREEEHCKLAQLEGLG